MTKEEGKTQRREVIKNIFFSFVVALPIFNTLSFLFRKEKRGKKPSSKELTRNHKLAG